jgi:hypothetical protein
VLEPGKELDDFMEDRSSRRLRQGSLESESVPKKHGSRIQATDPQVATCKPSWNGQSRSSAKRGEAYLALIGKALRDIEVNPERLDRRSLPNSETAA